MGIGGGFVKTIYRILDFIKSLFYYPQMAKYFTERGLSDYNRWSNEKLAALKYAWWHCHVGKLR